MSETGFMDFTFDSGDEKIGRKVQSFKAKENETYRMSFVWFSADGKPRFTGCERHYLQGVGYFLHKGPDFARLAGGPPKQAVATIIVLWPTDNRGRLNADAFKRGEGYQIMPWVFSADKYDIIKRRHDSFPLQDHDLTVHCPAGGAQYQKLDISPENDSLYQKLAKSENDKAKTLAKTIMTEVDELAKNLRTILARDLTLDQIREKIGGAGAVGGPAAATGENMDVLIGGLLDD